MGSICATFGEPQRRHEGFGWKTMTKSFHLCVAKQTSNAKTNWRMRRLVLRTVCGSSKAAGHWETSFCFGSVQGTTGDLIIQNPTPHILFVWGLVNIGATFGEPQRLHEDFGWKTSTKSKTQSCFTCIFQAMKIWIIFIHALVFAKKKKIGKRKRIGDFG